jgi:predicted regulator of Ras-like GTPase activity (Roadblock/LC7/MglB family)
VKEVLEPLARVPGVRFAVMVSADGVPIAVQGSASKQPEDTESTERGGSPEDLNAFAGLAAGWLNEIRRAVDPLTWDPPQRVVLSAQRGTLILLSTRGAILAVVLERGMSAEELRLPMEAASARLLRMLRKSGFAEEPQPKADRRSPRLGSPPAPSQGPPAPLPAPAADGRERVNNEVPEASRER